MTNNDILNNLLKLDIDGFKLTNNDITGLSILPDGVLDLKLLLDYGTDVSKVKISVTKLLKIDLKIKGVKIDIKVRPKKRDFTFISMSSGKGGVGKSTSSIYLARALNKLGYKTGILDSDLYGASIPLMLNYTGDPTDMEADENGNMVPIEVNGIQFISAGLFLPKDAPLLWRGPLLNKMLIPFFNEVAWDVNTKFIIIDEPPGTGDIKLDIKNFVDRLNTIVVTTPDPLAARVALKGAIGSIKIGSNVLGVIENMSYIINDNKRYDVYGSGGGKIIADKLETDVLLQVPITTPDNLDKYYIEIAKKILERLNV